ncbi:LysR substrate-binding domain-containing protein, partial [Klebsiella pneumoniae]|nr:LysR substrate-binding domain-containing protein [Klebsiella pneumoniae]
ASNVMRLHLGVPALFAGERLLPRLPELRKLHPRLHIDLDTGSQLDSELGDSLDAAIILAKEPDPALHSLRLDHNKVHAFVN